MHSFKTHSVEIEKRELQTIDGHELWTGRLIEKERVEGGYTYKTYQTGKVWNCSKNNFVDIPNNAFVSAVGLAYNQHLPLSLSPDAVWSVIGHGFSIWINENAEKVRKRFVKHDGKEKLVVEIPGPEAHNPNWNRILREFSDMLADHVGKKRDLFVNDFSTTAVDARIGSEALLMYAMSKYFDYGMRTLCGFPRITIEGTPEDWEKIVDRVRYISEFALDENDQLKIWVDRLLPAVQEFADASKGSPNIAFWREFYKEDGGSGGPFVDGHINSLFPYLKNYKSNIFANEWENTKRWHGPSPSDFPNSYSPVDVEWDDLGLMRDMKFHGGVIGVSYNNNIVRPEVGWCISETLEKENK
jgi:hypothetical protein